jgi:hypothetical protein
MAKSEQPPPSARKKGKEAMYPESHGGSSGRASAQLDPRIQHEIGKHLRAVYDDVINEPVPDKFMKLLEQLERSATRKS